MHSGGSFMDSCLFCWPIEKVLLESKYSTFISNLGEMLIESE
jgi:hypothetical protein